MKIIIRITTELDHDELFVPLNHIDHVRLDRKTGEATVVSAEYREGVFTPLTHISVERGQAVRLKILLDANAFHLDDEVATFPGGA